MNDDERVVLNDGEAMDMGDGNFMIFQTDEYGKVHSILLTEKDRQHLAALAA